MIQKILCVLLSVAMLLTLAACGSSEAAAPQTDATQGTDSTEAQAGEQTASEARS